VLDKNPDEVLESIIEAKGIIEKNVMNSVFCYEPFLKTKFLANLIKKFEIPIIYLDFDLMYSGYITSEMLPLRENVIIWRPSKEGWNQVLKTILQKISQERCLVIIDSLNGFSNLFEGKDTGREINAYIMLMASMANQTKSNVLFVSMARKNDEKEWVLSPTSRHILENKKMMKALLKKDESEYALQILNEDNTIRNSVRLN
jgi:hypothetical protein